MTIDIRKLSKILILFISALCCASSSAIVIFNGAALQAEQDREVARIRENFRRGDELASRLEELLKSGRRFDDTSTQLQKDELLLWDILALSRTVGGLLVNEESEVDSINRRIMALVPGIQALAQIKAKYDGLEVLGDLFQVDLIRHFKLLAFALRLRALGYPSAKHFETEALTSLLQLITQIERHGELPQEQKMRLMVGVLEEGFKNLSYDSQLPVLPPEAVVQAVKVFFDLLRDQKQVDEIRVVIPVSIRARFNNLIAWLMRESAVKAATSSQILARIFESEEFKTCSDLLAKNP